MRPFQLFSASLLFAVVACAASGQERAALRLKPTALLGDARFRHASSITHIAPLADGRRALSCAHDGSIRLWDLQNGRELRRYEPAKCEDVWNVLLLPGEAEFLSCGEDNHITRWNLETGEIVARYQLAADVMRLAVVPGGKQFIACDTGMLPSLWDIDGVKPLRRFKGHRDAIYSAIVTPDAKLLITASEDGSIRAWELATGDEVWTIAVEEDPDRVLPELPRLPEEAPKKEEKPRGPGHTADVYTVCLLPGGKQFASCSADQHVALWNTADGSPVWKVALPAGVKVIACSPDGKQLAATCGDEHIYVLRTSDGKQQHALPVPGGDHWPVTWSVDGQQLLSGGDGIVHRWDATTGDQLFPPPANDHLRGGIDQIAVSPAGKRMFATGAGERVYVWDLPQRRQIAVWPCIEDVEFLEVSADGKLLLVAGTDVLTLLDATSGKQRHRIGVENSLRAAALADGGRVIVAGDYRGQISAWDTSSGRQLYARSIEGEDRGDLERLVVSSDGQRLAAIGEKAIEIRKVADGSRLARFAHTHGDSCAAALFLPEDAALLFFNDDDDAPIVAPFLPSVLAPTTGLSPENIRKLAKQLGDDDFSAREQAMQHLIQAGPPVLANLPQDDASDSEVRWRVAKIRDAVRVGLIPTASADCVALKQCVTAATAHPLRHQWAMISGRGSAATVTLGRLNGKTIQLGNAASDGHSPACIAFSPDGASVVTGNRDGTISLFTVSP